MVMPVKIFPLLPDFFIYFDIIYAYLTKLAFGYGGFYLRNIFSWNL
jgi:hypothetical protein